MLPLDFDVEGLRGGWSSLRPSLDPGPRRMGRATFTASASCKPEGIIFFAETAARCSRGRPSVFLRKVV